MKKVIIIIVVVLSIFATFKVVSTMFTMRDNYESSTSKYLKSLEQIN